MAARRPARPESLKVAGHEVAVGWVDGPIASEGALVNGVFDSEAGALAIQSNLQPDVVRTTALHESSHALFTYSGISYLFFDNDAEKEERFVRAYVGPMLAFIRDNPDFIRFLQAT